MANEASSQSSETMTGRSVAIDKSPSHWKLVISQSLVTQEVLDHRYQGAGTAEDPFLVDFIPNDPRNPMLFSQFKKWLITLLVAFVTLAVAFVSSAYSGGVREIMMEFGVGSEVAVLGISLFVLGFAIGPLLWAPMSEMYGRQLLLFGTYAALTAFNAGAAGSKNIQTLLIMRFWAGAFGSSPLTNAGGVIADMFPAKERGLAMSVFAAAPFMGPSLGPIVGGFVGQDLGWRWLEGIMAIFTGVLWIIGALTIPETYAPVILRRRATALANATGKVYISKLEADSDDPTRAKPSAIALYKTALSRPWILLLREPIVLLLSIYMAIIYGTLYMMFSAFPIVFQQTRGWSQGIGGLPFLGVAVGMILGVIYTIPDNGRFAKAEDDAIAHGEHRAPPEARLPPSLVGCVLLPIGLFWFAWTNGPNVHWIVPIIAAVPFGAGMVLVFLSVMNYLIDSYTIYAASVLAANSVLRSLFGAVFPLFTTYMYQNLGIHWASSIPAFLALACVPFPFIFYKYGAAVRKSCKFASKADEMMQKLQRVEHVENGDAEPIPERRASHDSRETKGDDMGAPVSRRASHEEKDLEKGTIN